VQQAVTTTVAPTTTMAPTTTTGAGLPATGSGGTSTLTVVAIGVVLVGAAMLIVAQVRRKQDPTPA
jgi:LPXTG-motif cell wall-anchored protein